MNPRQRLDDYLAGLRQRLRWAIFTRAGAAFAASIVVILGLAVYFLNLSGFPVGGVILSRVALLIAIAVIAAALVWWPLRRLNDRSGAATFERELPAQSGRIQTYLEQTATERDASLLTDLLAEDALKLTDQAPIEEVVPSKRIWIAGAIAGAGVLVLLGVLIVSRSEWGYGSRYVLLGMTIPHEVAPVRQVTLKPGDITMRRNADLKVQADVKGFKPDSVELLVRFADSDRWEAASMQHVKDDEYGFTLFAVRAPLEYYVRADSVKSSEHAIKVVDVPRIESMQLSYHYPDWTGLQPYVEKEQRDIRAVADTQVKLSVKSSEPLQDATVVIDKSTSPMQSSANASDGALTVSKPAHYYVASRVAGEMVALTDEYEISVVDDEAPTIEVVKPGRDARASSIEEVPVTVRAKDDFKVQNVELRYSVNGGDWKKVKLPAQGAESQSKTLLALEELGGKTPLVPGDLITYYAATSDRNQSAQTDLYMVEVQPFERNFREGQGGGGGGGGGGDSEEQQIAERQRDLLVATWNLERARDQKRRTPTQIKESAEMLSGLQDKLAEQTNTLAQRTRARAPVDTDARVRTFVESLEAAAKAMAPASKNLNEIELQKAIPSEQTALQMLQRAEASFRDIQVARQQSGQSGAARASRDIAELYELEMDLTKSKYETEKEVSQDDREQTVDEAINKLKELARRQEQLAEQRRQQQAQTNADRWRQEQLRREAEQLRKRLEQLTQQMAQNGQQSNQQSNSKSNGQSSGQSSNQSSNQSGDPSDDQSNPSGNQSNEQKMRDAQAALKSVESALQAMRNAENGKDNQRAADEASRALKQAADRMQQGSQSGNGRNALANSIEQYANQAKQLANQQRKSEVDLHNALSSAENGDNLRRRRDGLSPEQARKLAEQKSQMLSDLQALEEKLRSTAQGQRRNAPQTSERLATIIDELSSSNVPARITRAITDLERGRADQSVLGEGLITEALQNAAGDLSEAAKLASQEAERKAQAADPESLLAQVAQLREAIQSMQQRGREGGNQSGSQPGRDPQNAQNQNGQNQNGQNQNGQNQSGQDSNSPGNSQGNSQASNSSGNQSGGQNGGLDRGGINQIGPGGLRTGGPLGGAWTGGLAEHRIGDGETPRLNTLRQQLDVIRGRLAAGSITRSDLEALRSIIPRVRYLPGDPLANQADLAKSIDMLELAALSAAEKARQQKASRAGASAQNATADNETVAEYYRRLGK